MAERKAFPLRLRADYYDALRRWADDELRSVNGQMEYLLAQALREAGRLPRKDRSPGPSSPPSGENGIPPEPTPGAGGDPEQGEEP